jgi:preprotein translocase SecF subunit
MRFGPGAVAKMIQDVFMVLGFYAFFWRSFDLTAVAALLTVIGYSVNDVIVIYDRIRENLLMFPKRALRDNINTSLNETLGRSINTSLSTIISLIGVLIFGTAQIWNFAAAMVIGVCAATFSSTFLASSMVLWFEDWKKFQASKAKKSRA